MQLDFNTISVIATIIFSAGMLYNKIDNLEKRVNSYSEHAERIARLETLLNISNLSISKKNQNETV